ncbi:MAG TPA: hypothetical protein VM509_00260 [Planctomycetota bacterium]|nr:hypothetical protein [Planctomycetota bacterium]
MKPKHQQQESLLCILSSLRVGVTAVQVAEGSELQRESALQARRHVEQLRRELYEQVVQGPMSAIEAHQFLSPQLNGAPLDVLLAVVATLDQARRAGPPKAS